MDSSEGLFEIVVGTYEEYLLGYKLIKTDKDYKLNHSIASHSHKASLRCVVSHGKFLASGGADECIQLYDLHTRKECGLLMHHSGTVTSLSFTPDGHYLISASEDGSLAMFAVGSWVLDKVWTKAHKGKGVNDVSIHPSGKMALSIGNDCTLRTWNLVKGRCAYIVNISSKCKQPEIIKWSPCGQYFGLVYGSNVDFYKVDSASVVCNVQLKHKISSIQFIKENKVCLGISTGSVVCYDFLLGEEIWSLSSGQEARIKCLDFYENWLVTANSSGIINVYLVSEDQTPHLVTSQESSCRITCLTISHVVSDDKSKILMKKRNRNFDEIKIENKIKTRKIINTSDKYLQCCPADQKWHIDIV